MKKDIIELVNETRVIAIVRGLDSGFVPLAQALYDGGIRAMEITFDLKRPDEYGKTTDAIQQIRLAMGDKMAVGAGTVVSARMAEYAAAAGAEFIVSPNMDTDMIRRTKDLGMISMPGAFTPSEAVAAHEAGADFVKLFPAAALGSAYIKLIRGPLNHIRFLAVGGVNESNIGEFIKAGCVGAGCGGNLVNKTWIKNGEFDKIKQLAGTFIENARVE